MGGSIFMQNQNAERQLAYKSLIIRSFYGKNKKVFVLGSNFGPFHSQGFYDAYKKLFSKLEDLCFRDSKSYELFSDLNNVRYAPDVVFSLKSSIPLNEKKRQVGFSLINIKNRQGLGQHHHSYISKMAELVKKFVQDNYEVKLFSFCEGEGDIQSIYEVIDTDPEIKDKVKIINYLGAIDATLDEFQSCEFIIGTRFHSIILGLLFECHIIPIYYSDKTFNYLNDLGIGHFGFWIEDIEKLTFRKIMGSQPLSVHKLHILEADQQFKKLSQFLYK
jgi:colanic acid/amylovoran biosynthesis protein